MENELPLMGILDVKQISTLEFQNLEHRENFRNTLYGGQVIGQALMAASKTVEGRNVHSMHSYFLRAGSSKEPVKYTIEKVRDGRSFSTRRVVASQLGMPIFHMTASYHIEEKGYEHQDKPPIDVPSPEELMADKAYQQSEIPEYNNTNSAVSPFELLPIPKDLFSSSDLHAPDACFWLRTVEPLVRDFAAQSAALAFVSDLGLLATAVLPHPSSLFSPDLTAASIDHSMWFHTPSFDVSKWLLCTTHSPWAANARGLATASIYTQQGELIANTAQEGLIRPMEAP